MEVKETSYPGQKFIAVEKEITIDQIKDQAMYKEAGSKIHGYLKEHDIEAPKTWAVLYKEWDEANNRAVMSVAMPIDNLDSVKDPEIQIVEIPEARAVEIEFSGDYDQLFDVHGAIHKYMQDNGIKTLGGYDCIEHYLVSAMQDQDKDNWETKVSYLY